MRRALILPVAFTLLLASAGCKRVFGRARRDAGAASTAATTRPTTVVLDDPIATADTTLPLPTAAPTAKAFVPPKAATASAAIPVVIAFADGQTWNGTYTCAQGLTGVALHITHVSGNDVEAVFDFTVPSAPNGKYKMSGVYAPGTRHLRLEPGAWIVQPTGYGPVPVDATVSADGKSYSGRIDAQGCSDFAVRR
jgi:hypothetical protein